MASRVKKKARRRAQKRDFSLPGYPDLNEFLKVCFETPVEKGDELLRDLSAVANAVGMKRVLIILRHMVIRLAQYDELYQLMIDDIELNIKQFERMRKMSVLSDDDEVRIAHKNMMTMASRLDEFITQMEEISGQKLRKVTQPIPVINVTHEAEKLEGI
jgi:hypothetical protein